MNKIESATLVGVKSSIGYSLIFKIFSVIFSLLAARFLGLASFGEIAVSQQLYISMSTFLMKEAYRREAQRRGLPQQLALESGFISVSISIILSLFWVFYLNAALIDIVALNIAIALEAHSESFLYARLQQLDFACRAKAETVSNFSRSISFGLFVFLGYETLSFGLSQIVFSLVWWFILRTDLGTENRSIYNLALIRDPALKQAILLAGQKLVMSEAEKIVLMSVFKVETWGAYGLVTNFGSLILRTFFAPIEDVAFSAFSRGDTKSSSLLLFIQSTIGLLAACYGPPTADVILSTLYGQARATEQGLVLLTQAYCILIALFSVNGITESFFFATATQDDMSKALKFQLLTALTQTSVSVLLSPIGPLALLISNAIGMIMRILFCWRFKELHIQGWKKAFSFIGFGCLSAWSIVWLGFQGLTKFGLIALTALLSSLPALYVIYREMGYKSKYI